MNRKIIRLIESLLELTNRELAFRAERKVDLAEENERIPIMNALKDFNFYFQPSVTR